MADARLKFFGWGREGEAMTADEEAFTLRTYRALFGVDDFATIPVPGLDAIALRAPRLAPPVSRAAICSIERHDRAAHAFGKSYQDTRTIRDATGHPGQVTCRFTHVYPEGPAPYFTFHALGRHGALLEQWRAIKSAASDALIAAGGTITHHHAVGREHRPWYNRERPNVFAQALRATKRTLDPSAMLNPGVLIDP